MGAAEAEELSPQVDIPLSPILSPAILHSDPQLGSALTGGMDEFGEGSLWEIVAGLPTIQDLQVMATSIVNALSRELHDLRQKVDTVEERVTVLETSTTTVDARISNLETEHWAFRRHLVEVQLRLDDGKNRSRRNNLRLRGLPEATMGPDLRVSVAILNQILGKALTAELELDRVHRIPGPRAPQLSPQDPAAVS